MSGSPRKRLYEYLQGPALAVLICAPCFGVVGWMSYWLYSANWLDNHGLIAEGTITKAEVRAGSDPGSESCSEDVEFLDVDKQLRHTTRSCSDPVPPASKGSHVLIHYAPGAPDKNYVEGDSRCVEFVVYLIFAALVLLSIGVKLLKSSKPRSSKSVASR